MNREKLSLPILKRFFPVVSLGTLFISLILFCRFALTPDFIKGLLLSIFSLYIAVIDWHYQLIFDKMLLPMLLTGCLFFMPFDVSTLYSSLIAAFLFSGILLMCRIITRGGMGGGDIKLAFILGIWLGLPDTIIAFFLSFWLGGLISALILIKGTTKKYIAFGPFLVAGALLAFLFGNQLLTFYRSIIYV